MKQVLARNLLRQRLIGVTPTEWLNWSNSPLLEAHPNFSYQTTHVMMLNSWRPLIGPFPGGLATHYSSFDPCDPFHQLPHPWSGSLSVEERDKEIQRGNLHYFRQNENKCVLSILHYVKPFSLYPILLHLPEYSHLHFASFETEIKFAWCLLNNNETLPPSSNLMEVSIDISL